MTEQSAMNNEVVIDKPDSFAKTMNAYRSRRVTAYIVDYWLIMAGPFFLLAVRNEEMLYAVAPYDRALGMTWAALYLGTCCLFLPGQTIGLKLARLKLLTANHETPGFLRSALRHGVLFGIVAFGDIHRNLPKSLDDPFVSTLMLVGLLMVLILLGNVVLLMSRDKQHQLIHDQIAKVFCVDQRCEQVHESVKSINDNRVRGYAFLAGVIVVAGIASFNLQNSTILDRDKWMDADERAELDMLHHPWVRGILLFEGRVRVNCVAFPQGDERYDQLQMELAEIFYGHVNDSTSLTVRLEPKIDFLLYEHAVSYWKSPALTRTDDRDGWLEATSIQ